MSFSEKIKQIQRTFGRYALILTRAVIRPLPYGVFRVVANVLGVVARPALAKKRKLAITNLNFALGKEKSEEEIKRIANECFDVFGRGMVDLIYFADRRDEIRKRVRFEGKENLDNVLKNGKGAVLVSAHFGNFILMYLRLVEEGYKTNVIMRRTRDRTFEQYISQFRDERGLKTIYDLPPRQCVQQSLRALRNNELLVILLDQNYGTDGRVFVDFFGREAATATGPVVFANRTGAPILPMFIQQEPGERRHKITIEPPIALIQDDTDEEKSVIENVAKITKIIENQIRRYPAEWGGWMHNRWKSRTLEEQAVIDRMNAQRHTEKKLNLFR